MTRTVQEISYWVVMLDGRSGPYFTEDPGREGPFPRPSPYRTAHARNRDLDSGGAVTYYLKRPAVYDRTVTYPAGTVVERTTCEDILEPVCYRMPELVCNGVLVRPVLVLSPDWIAEIE